MIRVQEGCGVAADKIKCKNNVKQKWGYLLLYERDQWCCNLFYHRSLFHEGMGEIKYLYHSRICANRGVNPEKWQY